jgi:carbamoyltransferase
MIPILAFNDPFHDTSFFLWEGDRATHIETERFSRRKVEYVNPMLVFCELYGARVTSFKNIAVHVGGPVSRYLEQIARFKTAHGENIVDLPEIPLGPPDLIKRFGPPLSRNDTDSVRALIRHLMEPDVNIYFCGHHAAHAANAFYTSPFDSALTITLDGLGWDFDHKRGGWNIVSAAALQAAQDSQPIGEVYGSVYDCRANRCTVLHQVTGFSIGWMWSRVTTALLDLKYGEEGTAMAMASLGDPARFRNNLEESCASVPGLFLKTQSQREMLARWAQELRGEVSTDQDRYDLAAALQATTEHRIRRFLRDHIGAAHRRLCLSGGVFQNCQIAGKIQDWFPHLENIYIPPAPYDGGLSIGAAQLVHHQVLGQTDRLYDVGRIAPYAMGKSYGRAEVESAIAATGLVARNAEMKEVVKLLARGDVIGLFQGGAESGRRALGNRSIIAHPGFPGIKERLNSAIKHRQWFRPFAPMVAAEQVSEWFRCPPGFSSPYMSFAVPVRAEATKKIHNVVHFDGTARVQTVHRELSPQLHKLLSVWQAETGLPVLLNTSFNDREPIVETPMDALKTFMRTAIDHVFFADHCILVSSDVLEVSKPV